MQTSQFMIYFFLYSFLGWSIETIYCSLEERHFVYRGFLYGPVCPIYGFGALSILAFLLPFENHPFRIFFMGVFLTTVWEYLVSFLLEKIFHKAWWDYSDKPLNIKGRVCLGSSLAWGMLSLALVYEIHPFLVPLIERIPLHISWVISGGCLALLFTDACFSVKKVIHLNDAFKKWEELTAKTEETVAALRESYSQARTDTVSRLEQELKNLRDKQRLRAQELSRDARRFFQAFPSFRNTEKNSRTFKEQIKMYLDERKKTK